MVHPIGKEILLGGQGIVKMYAAGQGEYASSQRSPRGYSDSEFRALAELAWAHREKTYSAPGANKEFRLMLWHVHGTTNPETGGLFGFLEIEVSDKKVA